MKTKQLHHALKALSINAPRLEDAVLRVVLAQPGIPLVQAVCLAAVEFHAILWSGEELDITTQEFAQLIGVLLHVES